MKYKLLGNSGLRVSEMALGTMTFGTEWGWGADKKESKKIFESFANSGGNFIDTANRYTEGSSERYVGEFIKEDRDHFVLATKYTLHDKIGDPNYSGNHRKNMIRSVDASLKRLDTDYIDLLWLHAWDFMTPIDEVMRGLDDLVGMGKVHYIGISDTPAWIISQANTIASFRGWSAFVALQVEYNLLQREAERDLIPMANSLGLALTPWAPLAGGALTGKYLKGNHGRITESNKRRSKQAVAMTERIVKIAHDLGISPASLAIRWTMQKDLVSIPLVGARTNDQMINNLKVLNIEIPEDAMNELDKLTAIDMGFPHNFLSKEEVKKVVYGGTHNHIVR